MNNKEGNKFEGDCIYSPLKDMEDIQSSLINIGVKKKIAVKVSRVCYTVADSMVFLHCWNLTHPYSKSNINTLTIKK